MGSLVAGYWPLVPDDPATSLLVSWPVRSRGRYRLGCRFLGRLDQRHFLDEQAQHACYERGHDANPHRRGDGQRERLVNGQDDVRDHRPQEVLELRRRGGEDALTEIAGSGQVELAAAAGLAELIDDLLR